MHWTNMTVTVIKNNDIVEVVEQHNTVAVASQSQDTVEVQTYTMDDELYEGPYAVVPKLTEIVLETKGKAMTDDVLVNEIPIYEVSNQYGTTVTIG